jgi:hypothetical protein
MQIKLRSETKTGQAKADRLYLPRLHLYWQPPRSGGVRQGVIVGVGVLGRLVTVAVGVAVRVGEVVLVLVGVRVGGVVGVGVATAPSVGVRVRVG